MNYQLRRVNSYCDLTIFVGSWLQDLKVWTRDRSKPHVVIYNGSDEKIFSHKKKKLSLKNKPLKLVTHHWSSGVFKGFDIYKKIDLLLEDSKWKSRLSFTYIGNVPPGLHFKNTQTIRPLFGEALANELRRHDAYVTGSIGEPGSNHQNEAALCGLPLLYRISGALPEYCQGYGLGFEDIDFEARLDLFLNQISSYKSALLSYPNTASHMIKQYAFYLRQLIEDGTVTRPYQAKLK